MELAPFLGAFALIVLAELGDKTMITVIALSSKHSQKLVFSASLLALSLVSVVGVLIGKVLYGLAPAAWISIVAGILFLVFGLATLLRAEKEEAENGRIDALGAFGGIFALMAIMEMGDKTQLSIIALSAQYGAVIEVLIGAVAAFALVTFVGVFLGREIGKRVAEKYVRYGSALVFVAFGLLFLIQGALGLDLL
ncbi:MAG: TMEM165/GDT1 family protein [Methanomassiliicoccales archaeon]